jgi:hypothetical protein
MVVTPDKWMLLITRPFASSQFSTGYIGSMTPGFQYVHAGNSAEFTVVSEAPFLVERGFPRFRAKLPNSFKEGGACEETLRWRVDATRRVADYLRRDQVWSPAAIDLSDLESFDGYRPSRVIW